MIKRFRKKLIGICVFSFLIVFAIVMALLTLVSVLQTNRTLDKYADVISENQGKFPVFGENRPGNSAPPVPSGFNRESPFTTRYFTVRYGEGGSILSVNTEFIASISAEDAELYGKKALETGKERGWLDDYRYKLYEDSEGYIAVFVSGINEKASNKGFLLAAFSVFLLCGFVIVGLIILISGFAVRPAAESYEKQKQFITNASHELKTPLTLIGTNLDILESEYGKSEWLSDIREETLLMNELVCSMVNLARMDEEAKLLHESFNLSEAVGETASMFVPAAKATGKALTLSVAEDIYYTGNEQNIRRLVSVLMDNAVKYCDKDGEITASLSGEKRPVLTVENTFPLSSDLDLSRIFDRFYRADKARTYGTGFGIGLSLAKSIAEQHGGSISAYQKEDGVIGFKVKL